MYHCNYCDDEYSCEQDQFDLIKLYAFGGSGKSQMYSLSEYMQFMWREMERKAPPL